MQAATVGTPVLEFSPNTARHGALSYVTAAPVIAFALWTIACQLCVVFHLSFAILSKFAPLAILAGMVLALRVAAERCGPNGPAQPALRSRVLPWLAGTSALIILRALGVGYSAFWIGSVLLLTAALFTLSWANETPGEEPAALGSASKLIFLLLILIAPVLTYVAHRPDVDDAVYVGTAADAVAHPNLPVLSHDVLYGTGKLPLMLPSYALESYGLLVGAAAKLLGGSPIFWAHAIFPTLLAVLVPLCWARLMRMLAPRYWVAATVIALLMLSLPADFRGFGNFAFVRLFQGKALLLSAGIPLLFVYAWRFEESRSFRAWLPLAATAVACVGLSASAVFIVPLALIAAAMSGWRKGLTTSALLALVPAAYPLLCGLIISTKFNVLQNVFAYLPARASLAATTVFGSRTENLFLLGLLTAPFLVRDAARRRLLTVLVLSYFLLALNPYTFKLFSRFTTRDAAWRLLWCVPVCGIVAAGATAAWWVQEARGKVARYVMLAIAIGGLAYLWPHSSFSPSNGVRYSLAPLKVNASDYEAARAAIAATPPGDSVLAPEAVAVWIPTFVHRVPLVSVRAIYDDEMGAHMPPEEAKTRHDLRELVSGTTFSPEYVQQLLAELPQYSVGVVVVNESATERLSDDLRRRGYARSAEVAGNTFFVRTENQPISR